MAKLITVHHPEQIAQQAREYVKTYILLPSGLVGMFCLVGGVGGLGYQLIGSDSYTWNTFYFSSGLIALGVIVGIAQTRYHRYLLKRFPDVLAARIAALATVTEDGSAHVSTVSYVNQGLDVYFMTDPSSRKAKNIASSNRIALAVTEDYLDWDEIRGVHLSGTVEWIADEGQLRRVQKLFADKFPQVHKHLAGYGVTIDFIPFLKVSPAKIDYLDYSKGFNHWDTLEL